MPNIKPFDTPALSLRPTETGIETVAGNARRMGAFYNEVGASEQQLAGQVGQAFRSAGNAIGSGAASLGDAYVNYLDHKEISAGAANGTKLMSNLTDQWNEIAKTADPNDPSIKQKFMEETLEPALQTFVHGDGNGSFFSTEKSQQFAESFIERFRQHMEEKTSADMSTLAGIALKTNVQTTVNSLSSMVASDPSSLDFALKSADHAINAKVDSSPTLDATTGAAVRSEVGLKAKQDIVKSAVIGMIQKNPNIDLDGIQKKYGEYINGAEMKMFQKTAQVQARSDAAVQKQNLLLQKQLDEQAVHADVNKTINNNVSVDPQTGATTIKPQFFSDALKIVRDHPDAPNAASAWDTLHKWGEAQQNRERKVTTDQATVSNLDANMFTDNPTTKMDILKAEAAGKLTRTDAEIRTKIIDQRDKMPSDPQYKFAMDGAKELIEGRTAGEKTMQSGKYAAFMQDFLERYQKEKAAGTLPPNALSLRDPKSLINQTMESYKSPLAAAVGGNGGIIPPPPPAAMPAASEPPKYKPGDTVQGTNGPVRFKGGDYRKKENWEPVS